MIVKLAIKDILHDWLLSVCLILAIASIIAPLLILFGLKSGTIQTLRGRLVQDPKNREIRPVSSRSFHRDWFERIKNDHREIAFVIPMTRQISTSVTAVSKTGKTPLSLMATSPGDPLLLENGVKIPDRNGCVLTAAAARSLAIAKGDMVTLRAGRIIHGRLEKVTLPLQVTGILDERASGLKSAFVRLAVLEAVEDYRDGRAVSAYGWKGVLAEAYPVYDGAAVFTRHPLGKLEGLLLANNTGFTNIQQLTDRTAAAGILGFQPSPAWHITLVSVKKHAATEESIQAVKNKLRGKGAVVLPWVRPLDVILSPAPNSGSAHLRLFAVSEATARVSELEGSALLQHAAHGTTDKSAIMVPAAAVPADKAAELSFSTGQRTLSLPVSLLPGEQSGTTAFAAASLAGQLNLLRYRDLKFDTTTNSLLLSRRGYAGFRLYTRSIDDVETIQTVLEQEGIAVHTEKERIAEVRRLDRYMSLIFWLIATVGVIGGISALTASLYASVERKKRELNVLRLLGFLKRQIVLFPVSQGLILSMAGLLLGALVFQCVALVINHLFKSHLHSAESLCTLSTMHIVILVAGISACAVVSAALAAMQALRLDPAEALRDE